MQLPAFCNSCGTVFPSGFGVGPGGGTFSGNLSGPCPACGGMGRVPDGVFDLVGNTIQILSAPQQTLDDLSRLSKMLHEAREKNEEPDVVAKKIREILPALAVLLPSDRKEVFLYITILLTVIGLIIASTRDTNTTINVTVNQTINQMYIDTDKPTEPHLKEESTKKIGRNELCSCGSGKKYKKCCGKIQ